MHSYFCRKFSAMQEKSIVQAINQYKQQLRQSFNLKAVFFDMDGVLFDSMPLHAEAWLKTFSAYGLHLSAEEPYMNEGSTAQYTVKRMFQKYLNKEASDDLAEAIKQKKHDYMALLPQPEIIQAMPLLLQNIAGSGIDCWVVTGSGQAILIDRLEKEFHPALKREKMITANDVKKGKPDPEPYLMAMKKSGYGLHQSLVVENAPLGVRSAKAAGLFTIAINTGPINESHLWDAGADLVFASSNELEHHWTLIHQSF